VGRHAAGQLDVWVVNAKSGAMRRITDCPPTSTTCGTAGYGDADVYWFQPQWSPNGQEISFGLYGFPKGVGALAVGPLDTVRPDGSDLTQLPFPNPTPDPEAVQWSPDGRELAVNTADGVYIVDSAGTARWLTNIPGTAGVAWSPDGRELAIADNAGGIYGIYTIDADGKALTRLGAHAFFFLSPAWSPNGKELAYDSETGQSGVVRIWTIHADGSDRRLIYKITPQQGRGGGLAAGPIWSPDGSQLAFSSNTGTYVVNADGTHLHRIGQGSFGALAWQPNPSSR
jgi:Tol biopolymer transport system component